MGLFGKAVRQSYLGVDIGGGGIKIVELANEKGRARLVTYGFSERLPERIGVNFLDAPDELAGLIKKILGKAKNISKKAVAGLPVPQVFSSILNISVPASKKKELREAINQQARKITPRPLEEMVIDFKVVEEEAKSTKVLLTGAESTLVKKYIDIFQKAGLELVSLETEAFAIIRSLVGRDKSTVIIVDLGAARTNISVIEKGVPYISRSIDVGGITFTRAIAKQMGLQLEAAEQMKLDVTSMASIMPESGLPAVLQPIMKTVIDELRYVVNLYSRQQSGRLGANAPVEKIILTGGSAFIPRLSEEIGKAMDIRTYLGDPWARVVYPQDMRPLLDQLGSRFAVAIGLAMRDIE